MYFINGKFNSTFRDYDLYKKLGIISVSGKSNIHDIMGIAKGEIIALYSTRYGYLGAGRVKASAVPLETIEMHQGGLMIDRDEYPFREIMRINPHFGSEEYVLRVDWLALVPELDDGLLDDGLFVGGKPVEKIEDERTRAWVIDTFKLDVEV
ncbi:hypothetical protein [Salinicoccus carnicancri]|uniref:hypothetical protein n=1 Tax=Salinicoccus carnicancri TaxID=558170 RepID=UPI0002F5FABD|nr:hypothetical protein [Salinicoccus carnicancri]